MFSTKRPHRAGIISDKVIRRCQHYQIYTALPAYLGNFLHTVTCHRIYILGSSNFDFWEVFRPDAVIQAETKT